MFQGCVSRADNSLRLNPISESEGFDQDRENYGCTVLASVLKSGEQ